MCIIGPICNRFTGFVTMTTYRRTQNVSECLYSLYAVWLLLYFVRRIYHDRLTVRHSRPAKLLVVAICKEKMLNENCRIYWTSVIAEMNKDQQQSACYQRSTLNCPQRLKTLNSCSPFEFKHQLVVRLYMMTFDDFTEQFRI